MNYKHLLSSLFLLVALFILPISNSLAAPKDDIHTLYNPDGTVIGYKLVATPSFAMGGGTLPKMVMEKYFTPEGAKYTIRYPFFGDLPPVILKGDIIIENESYPLKKILVNYPEIKSEFSYLYQGPSFQEDPSLFEISEEVIVKITEAPPQTPIYFAVQGLEKDVVYHIAFHTSILNGLPLFLQVTPENADDYYKKKKGSGDPNHPKIILRTP